MAKFKSPLKEPLYVTQTYHSGSNNTAVDFSESADEPVYAIADGKISYRSAGLGSYCIQQLDNSQLKAYYVHTYKWPPVGTHVKQGQVIAYIAPTSLNGGNPTHLHLGLQTGKYLMDYMDKNISIKAGFTWGSKDNLAIRNAWFNGGSIFDWSKHKDLSYTNNSFKVGDNVVLTGDTRLRKGSSQTYAIKALVPKGAVGNIIGGPRTAEGYEWWDIKFLDNQGWMANPGGTRFVKTLSPITNTEGKVPVVTPEPAPETPGDTESVTELKKMISMLDKQIINLRMSLGSLNEKVKGLEDENKEWVEKYGTLMIEKKRIENEKLEWEKKYDECKTQLAEGNKNFIKKITDWIGEILSKITSGE